MALKENVIIILTGFYLLTTLIALFSIIIYDYVNKREKCHIPYYKAHFFLFIKNLTKLFIKGIIIICIFEKVFKWLGDK